MAEKFGLKNFLNNEQIRAKGIGRFILEIGIIRFAVPFAVLSGVVMYVFSSGLARPNIEEMFTGQKISNLFLAILIEGTIFGLIMWFWGKQRDYSKLNR